MAVTEGLEVWEAARAPTLPILAPRMLARSRSPPSPPQLLGFPDVQSSPPLFCSSWGSRTCSPPWWQRSSWVAPPLAHRQAGGRLACVLACMFVCRWDGWVEWWDGMWGSRRPPTRRPRSRLSPSRLVPTHPLPPFALAHSWEASLGTGRPPATQTTAEWRWRRCRWAWACRCPLQCSRCVWW